MIHFYSRVDPFQEKVLLKTALTKEELGCGDLIEKKPGVFKLVHDGKLVFVPSDALPWFHGGTVPGYPNCGIISAQLNDHFREKVNWLIPTDLIPKKDYLSFIPPRLLDRAMVRLPAKFIIPLKFSCYSRFEPDGPEELGWRWTLAVGIGKGMSEGDLLEFPCFIPVAEEGPLGLKFFLKSRVGLFREKRGLANYLYGLSVLLHLFNRGQALKAGIDRPFQKIKFGIFPKGLPNHGETRGNRWERATIRGKTEVLFGDLFSASGFSRNAWKKMPGFNIAEFVEFAWWNWKAGVIRLVGYFGTPHDGAYRSVSDTELGVGLIRSGNAARGKMLLKGYTCSAAAGVVSGGGEFSEDILHQLGRQHWRLMEQLAG